ncbi:MAG TPA: KGG domain-containing protein [Candidatus Saccharimonadaceae bacterium]|nr:KGG domain-containing protein [Candidatus Saccharimonadaceae bacterium]
MAGTKAGGQKAAAKNLAKDPDFYAKIGRKGGRSGHTGGFAANPALARVAGAKGGRISRRKKAVKQSDVALAA